MPARHFPTSKSEWLLKHGVQRGIEIISEASRHIPAELKATQPNIRWASIAGIGNVLRHEYHAISSDVIWKVARDELPPLRTAIESILARVDQ